MTNWNRRKLLGAAALGAAGSIAGLGTAAQAHGTLEHHNVIGPARLYYDPNGTGSGAYTAGGDFNPTFHGRLDNWWGYYYANTPTTWQTPAKIMHLGVHVDKGGMHELGRAIDLTRIKMTLNGGEFHAACLNKDQFEDWNSDGGLWYRRYWATVAGLAHHFQHVLHYGYNAAHKNHVHVDNAISGGSSTSSFDSGSDAQVQIVQGALHHIWGYSNVDITGSYGPLTQSSANAVLARIGRSGTLNGSGNWTAFTTATLRKGTGREAY